MRSRSLHTALIAAACMAASGAALAAGTINSVTVNKPAITLGGYAEASVGGVMQPDAFKKGCAIRITLRYIDNSTEVPHAHLLADVFPQTGFSLKPSKPGMVTVIADGGPGASLGYPACQGKVQTTLQVVPEISATPKNAPPHIIVTPKVLDAGLPPGGAALPTLTSIKQVPYTNHSGETWIEAQGTGNCSFTVTGAGLPPSAFATTAAKPFPLKVKIANAPLGSHLWTATGTGGCQGQVTTTFSVD